jgi:hypothetical protein
MTMRKLALGGVAILVVAGCVLAAPIFGDKSDRLALAALLMSVYALIISGVQALYAEDQAKSARRQADAAELANTREELTSLNMAEPKFEWMPPTGSRGGIDISFKNVGGLVQLTHAEVNSGNVDTPLQIPGGKISSGQTIRLHFKPPVEDQIYPMIVCLQFRGCSQEICESTVRCERPAEEFRTLS